MGFLGVRSRVPVAVALLTGATSACAGAQKEGGGWTTTVDTLPNGAVHVVNTPPSAGGSPQWTLQEELRIGSERAGSPDLFGQVKDLEVTADGRMAVLETQAKEIRGRRSPRRGVVDRRLVQHADQSLHARPGGDPPSLLLKRHRRIHPRRAARRNPTRQRRDRQHGGYNAACYGHDRGGESQRSTDATQHEDAQG